jgi:hypothetical protein
MVSYQNIHVWVQPPIPSHSLLATACFNLASSTVELMQPPLAWGGYNSVVDLITDIWDKWDSQEAMHMAF